MQIEIDGIQNQATAAGYASVEEYVHSLVLRDKDRLAIQKGYEQVQAGQLRPFEDFDAEMRQTLDK